MRFNHSNPPFCGNMVSPILLLKSGPFSRRRDRLLPHGKQNIRKGGWAPPSHWLGHLNQPSFSSLRSGFRWGRGKRNPNRAAKRVGLGQRRHSAEVFSNQIQKVHFQLPIPLREAMEFLQKDVRIIEIPI